jgi:hypothetical protein
MPRHFQPTEQRSRAKRHRTGSGPPQDSACACIPAHGPARSSARLLCLLLCTFCTDHAALPPGTTGAALCPRVCRHADMEPGAPSTPRGPVHPHAHAGACCEENEIASADLGNRYTLRTPLAHACQRVIARHDSRGTPCGSALFQESRQVSGAYACA